MGNGLRLGRIAGIEIHADWSLLVIFVLIASSLAMGLFPEWHPDWGRGLVWAAALAAAVALFASVLVHELSHALVGRAWGIAVRRITLFVFGGIAQMEQEPPDWRAEFWMAIIGPVTSAVLGFLCFLAAGFSIAPAAAEFEDPAQLFASLGVGGTLLMWLGQVNFVLAVFNLVPAFPLDGGRVLRALMWAISGDFRRATRGASGAGQAFAWFLIATGVAMILGARIPLLGGGLVGGVWIAFIGWFLNNAAALSYRQLLVREALRDVPVARLMLTPIATVPPDLPVSELVEGYLLRSDQRAFPVVADGRLEGMVCLHEVRRLDRAAWDRTAVRDIMVPADKLASTHPNEGAGDVLSRLAGRNLNQLPVLEDGRVRGLVRREDILKWLALYAELGAEA
ncbi:MAG TPA: site-2 protease family protein [Burkholderiales bacterium]|nr:site-2 protease family protein [Burkholderiales bacterium]